MLMGEAWNQYIENLGCEKYWLQGQMLSMDGAAVNLYYHLRSTNSLFHMDVYSVDKGVSQVYVNG